MLFACCIAAPSGAQQPADPPPAAAGRAPARVQIGPQERQVFDHVVGRAKDLAARPYQPPGSDLPPPLRDMTYDQHRSIRFRTDQALWRGEAPFEIQFFHPGFLFREPVTVNIIRQGKASKLPFDVRMFRYDNEAAPLEQHAHSDLGFAGFRIHYPLNKPDVMDEVMVFLGASYFRLIGPGQAYGLSARGLAVDTASPEGEEFPAFREFWLVEPGADARTLTLFALLDSPSVSGAYRFDLTPGDSTVVDVEAHIFARTDIDKVGIAPLTSMFHHSGNTMRFADDYRPQVHDSDGLQMLTAAGEWIWRPLKNPRSLRVTALVDRNPRGFGLAQRERRFEGYLDLEANYHHRPSHWVEPVEGDWEGGHVELVEIPTDSETNDNIVAYWVPDEPFTRGDVRQFRYRLSTYGSLLPQQEVAHVVRTRIGWGAVPGAPNPPPRSVRQFVVDFAGGELSGLDESRPVEARLDAAGGEAYDVLVHRLPEGQGWRVAFKLRPEGDTPSDMRLFLELDGRRLSETWSYVWYPEDIGS
ncbi:MAG: glucan biosynthesis protein D [Proteobacteria bacterium]|nr:MAG: glucan biosynthesis protein D [Pseudomonadota bacterium]